MEKQDLTEYSDSELSLLVFNDEGLYRMRKNSQFLGLLNDLFIFTDEQLAELEKDLDEEES
jgi:hypothetical protein